jgi:hypothetical protein
MKHKLPILTAMALGIVGVVIAGLHSARSSRAQKGGSEAPPFVGASLASVPSAAPAAATAPSFTGVTPVAALVDVSPTVAAPPVASYAPLVAGGTPQATELVRRSLDQLALFDSLSAQVRFHSNMFGQPLGGTGRYLQSGHAPTRVRLELKMPMGDDVCTLQQVCDGNALWTRRTLLDVVRLGRVDVPRVFAARQARLAAAPPVPGAPTKELAIGGLPLLVDGVRRAFDLQTVRTATVGERQVYVVSGTLRPVMLSQLLPDQKAAIDAGQPADLKALPEQAPTHVELSIGRDDLFPYKLDFKRIVDGKSNADEIAPMVSVEFYDVQRNIALDPVQFVYQPSDAVPVDDTEVFNSRQ